MTKVDIFSGFLGAGKTTLIKKLIKESFSGEKVVLIENEFGEIGIDGGFLKSAGVEITEMNSGCICCSLVGDFEEALKKVIDEFSPDRILIEPSGVGKLSDVIKAVSDVDSGDISLNSATVIADAKKCKMYMKNFGEFYNNQIENAGCIVLSRTKDMDDEKIADAVKLIKEHNDDAVIVTTDWELLTGEQILDAIEGKSKSSSIIEYDHHEHHHDCCDHDHHEHHHDCCNHDHHEHHHHADEVFASVGRETVKKYSVSDIENALNELENSDKFGVVLRAKGIVESTDGKWINFDYVPGESDIRFGNADITGKICVIGSELKEEEIEKLFGLK